NVPGGANSSPSFQNAIRSEMTRMSDPAPNPSDNPQASGTPPTAVTDKPPAAAPPKPALPTKPAPPKPPAKGGATRRGFLFFGRWIAAGWSTMTASLVAMVLGTVRFLFPNVLSEPPSTFKAGAPDLYEEGKVDDRFKTVGAWVIRGRNEQDQP